MKIVRALLLITAVLVVTAPAFATCRFCKPSGLCSSIGNPVNVSCVEYGGGVCEDFFDETCSEGLRELSDEWSLTSVEVRQSSKVKTAAPRPAQPAVARSAKAALPSV